VRQFHSALWERIGGESIILRAHIRLGRIDPETQAEFFINKLGSSASAQSAAACSGCSALKRSDCCATRWTIAFDPARNQRGRSAAAHHRSGQASRPVVGRRRLGALVVREALFFRGPLPVVRAIRAPKW